MCYDSAASANAAFQNLSQRDGRPPPCLKEATGLPVPHKNVNPVPYYQRRIRSVAGLWSAFRHRMSAGALSNWTLTDILAIYLSKTKLASSLKKTTRKLQHSLANANRISVRSVSRTGTWHIHRPNRERLMLLHCRTRVRAVSRLRRVYWRSPWST